MIDWVLVSTNPIDAYLFWDSKKLHIYDTEWWIVIKKKDAYILIEV